MKIADENALRNLCIDNVMVTSGIRPKGRSLNRGYIGRKNSGFLYIWQGEATFYEKGRPTVKVGPGEMAFIPQGLTYKLQYTGENNTFVLINFELFEKGGTALVLQEHITHVAREEDVPWIGNIMAKFEIISGSESPAAVFRKKELLYRLLTLVYTENFQLTAEQLRYPQITEGVQLLKQHYLENIPIPELAEACNLSVSSFRELFHKQYGMSPVQYRKHLRIRRAQELLSEGSCTVAEAAFASGFENIGYFCTCYKAITGETPSQTKKTDNEI